MTSGTLTLHVSCPFRKWAVMVLHRFLSFVDSARPAHLRPLFVSMIFISLSICSDLLLRLLALFSLFFFLLICHVSGKFSKPSFFVMSHYFRYIVLIYIQFLNNSSSPSTLPHGILSLHQQSRISATSNLQHSHVGG